jgi:hypothetical protein
MTSSLYTYSYTQGGTPSEISTVSAQGPSNAAFACYPSPRSTIVTTFAWYKQYNGCPVNFSYRAAGPTCIFATQTNSITYTWQCVWTLKAYVTTTVNGGTVTLANGAAVTSTAPTVYVTNTQTQQSSRLYL